MGKEYLDKAGLTYFWSKLKARLQKDYDRTVSRGEQLITNGTALLGDNTNFSRWIYDGEMANGSAGSFTLAAGTYAGPATDDFFPINPTLNYRLDIDFVSALGIGRMYTFPALYDVDKKEISSSYYMYRPNTLTTLTSDLKTGDTQVHLSDLTNWDVNTSTRTYQRGFLVWNYTNSFGYTYPENTYSRNVYSNLYQDANVNKTTNTITLDRAWSGATIPAGTKLSQSDSGAGYKYIATSYTQIPTTWTSYTGYIGGVDYSGRNVSSKFPPGVAYAKIGFLWNYQGAGNGEQIWTTNISFKEVPSKASKADSATNAASATTATELSLSARVTGSTVNNFKGTTVKAAQIGSMSISGLAGSDGIIAWIPYNDKYGRQLIFDDTTHKIFSRYYNNGTWGGWEAMALLNKTDANALMNALDTGSSTPVDNDYYISQYVGGGTSTTTYHRRPVSALWDYIKGKISSVLGLTSAQYGGNAATATNASKVNNHTVESDVPANAKFTDTVTTATTSGNGNAVTAISASNGALTVTKGTTFLTSHQDISGKADKTATVSTVAWDGTNKKLTKTINGTTSDVVTAATLRTGLNVADGAEVNQNAFSNVKVGSTTVAADTKTDTLELVAGSNVTITPDATNDKITIAATDTTYESKTAASGGTAVSLVTTGEKYTWNNKSTVPTNHASTATTYGAGSASNYGHVKLSESTSSTSGASGGIAATPSAVKTAYDLADTANTTANSALSGVNGNLIYDHTFTISNGVATFTPHVYQKGTEVTSNYAASCFTWKYRLINGTEVTLTTKSNRGCDVTISNMGYGGHVIGIFTPPA